MSALRRLALAFPTDWSHRRPYSCVGINSAGNAPYYIAWDGGSGTYGEDWTQSPRDNAGILLTYSANVYHPIRIAQYALSQFGSWYAGGDEAARREFEIHASWLRDNQRTEDGIPGLYVFDFPWPKYGAPAGWRSAMAQGEAISVLLRADAIMPGHGYATAAERASIPFRHAIDTGGVVWRERDATFLEEIANVHAPHVLNGCIFALWGIWELYESANETWLSALIEETLQTLRRWLDRFDNGWWSLYSLMRSGNGHDHIATLKYHAFHIAQMHVLSRMFRDDIFAITADRWTEYLSSRRSQVRVLLSNAASVLDRARGFDTVAGGAHT